MQIKPLIAAFLAYLQLNNQQQGNVYEENLLEKQCNDYESTLNAASQRVSWIIRDRGNPEGMMADFVSDVHRNCSKTAYWIAKNTVKGKLLKDEPGKFRYEEIFSSLKEIPLIDSHNERDRLFLTYGKMPQFLDARLKRMGFDSQNWPMSKKIKKMHGQKAWMAMNDVLQIASYIYAHFGEKESYYFLRAYYKIYYRQIDQSVDSKAMFFATYLEKEIQTIGKRLNIRFKKNAILTEEEHIAYGRVYIIYPLPKDIKRLFSTYIQYMVSIINDELRWQKEKIPTMIADLVTTYITIHPFQDANYRTIAIVVNALLSYHGYEPINFHDANLKKAFNIPFNETKTDPTKIIALLEEALIKEERNAKISLAKNNVFQTCEQQPENGESRCEVGTFLKH